MLGNYLLLHFDNLLRVKAWQIFRLIEEEAKRQKKPAFDILIDEWGTSGKQRPTVEDLVRILIKVELYRAADYVSKELLARSSVERPEHGPSAVVPIDTEPIHRLLETTLHPADHQSLIEASNENVNQRLAQQQEQSTVAVKEFDTPLPHLRYAELEYLTDNFDLNPLLQNGRKLGAGAFGTVFLGQLKGDVHLDGKGIQIYVKLKLSIHSKIAIKKLHNQKVQVSLTCFRAPSTLMNRHKCC